MHTLHDDHTPLLRGVAAIFVIAVCAFGLAAFIGLIPGPVVHQNAYDVAAGGVVPVVMSSEPRCADCGMVEQIRGNADASDARGENRGSKYRIRVRMQDGGVRVFNEDSPPAFAVGDTITLSGAGGPLSGRMREE